MNKHLFTNHIRASLPYRNNKFLAFEGDAKILIATSGDLHQNLTLAYVHLKRISILHMSFFHSYPFTRSFDQTFINNRNM